MSEIPVIWVSVDEACRISGIGRSLIYEMIKDGRLKSAKVGTKRLSASSRLGC
jgi:excisionase family DNA binding protein